MPKQLATRGCGVVPDKLTYFVGSERVVPREQLIDLGRQISI